MISACIFSRSLCLRLDKSDFVLHVSSAFSVHFGRRFCSILISLVFLLIRYLVILVTLTFCIIFFWGYLTFLMLTHFDPLVFLHQVLIVRSMVKPLLLTHSCKIVLAFSSFVRKLRGRNFFVGRGECDSECVYACMTVCLYACMTDYVRCMVCTYGSNCYVMHLVLADVVVVNHNLLYNITELFLPPMVNGKQSRLIISSFALLLSFLVYIIVLFLLIGQFDFLCIIAQLTVAFLYQIVLSERG
jgi:hypothetical protein